MKKLTILSSCILLFAGLSYGQSIQITCPTVAVNGSAACAPATSITVSAFPATVNIGGTSLLTASANSSTGSIDVSGVCPWVSSAPTIVSVLGRVATGLAPGTANISCTWGGLSASIPFSITVATITFTSPVQGTCGTPCLLSNGINGTAYSYTFGATSTGGTCCTWAVTVGSIPAWASLNSSTGALTGTPNANATTLFTIQATDGGSNTASLAVSLTVTGAITAYAALPLTWVNSEEWNVSQTNTINFPSGWTCSGSSTFSAYANTQAGLQQAIDDAETCRKNTNNGTRIKVPHGTLYSGTVGLTLPQTAGDTATTFIVLTSDTPLPANRTACSHGIQDNLPASTQPGIRNLGCTGSSMSYQLGTTVTPVSGAFTLANGNATNTSAYNDVASMYTVECTATNCDAIQTAAADVNNVGPHHFAILNGEFRLAVGNACCTPIQIGHATETITTQLPTHMHFMYDYVHGDWTDAPVSGGVATGPPTGTNVIANDFAFLGCVYCSVSYSYTDRSLRPASEGHALSFLLAQHVKIVHSWLEGNSSGHLCGGFAAAINITNFVTCQDMEDRGNRYTYPYSWMLAKQAGFQPVQGSYVRKNAHEYKFGERVLEDGNIYENVDNSGAQNGTAFSHKTAQLSSGLGTNYWTTMDNYTVSNTIARNACNGPSLGDNSATNSSNGGGVALPNQFALFKNDLSYNLGQTIPGCLGATPEYGFRIGSVVPGNNWAATVLRDGSGLTTTATLASSPGQTISDMAVGDVVTVYGCSDTTFNTGNTSMGPPALTGTLLNGLTVVYANAGTAGAGAGVTGCFVANGQGRPNGMTFLHITSIDDTASSSNPSNSGAGGTNPYPLARNFTIANSVIINGGINSTWAEGTRTETKMFDPSTEVINNILWPGRATGLSCPGFTGAACYTEYSASHTATTPPTTIYLTPTTYCTGNDPTVGNCAGILAGMSALSFPITVADWHTYRPCHVADGSACNSTASPYAAGQAHDATDGTDLGINPSAIDAAEVLTLYVCSSTCGSPGPYTD